MLEPTSVIIPTYNRAHLISRAVTSALAAMEPQDELIVVDDGSTDDTATVLRRFGDRIRYLRQENGGVSSARNLGVAHARHRLVSFLDSDDEWMADALRLLRGVLRARPELVFCWSDFSVKDEQGAVYPHSLVNWHGDRRSWSEILGQGVPFSSLDELPPRRGDFMVHVGDMYPVMLGGLFVPVWTSLIRRDRVGEMLHFPEDIPIGEEWECYARMAKAGPVAFLDCDTVWNHGHAGPRNTSTSGVHGLLSARIRLTRRVWGNDPLFLARHRERYDATLAAVHLERARWLLLRGRVQEAREDLAAARDAPFLLRTLASLPEWVGRGLLALRRGVLRRGVSVTGSLLFAAPSLALLEHVCR